MRINGNKSFFFFCSTLMKIRCSDTDEEAGNAHCIVNLNIKI